MSGNSHFIYKLRSVAKYIFAPAFGESIGEIASLVVLFPDKKNIRHVARLSFMFFCYVCYIINGLFMPFIDTHLLPLPRESLGPLKYVAHILWAALFTEMLLTRILILFLQARVGKNKLRWFILTKDISSRDQPKLFSVSQFFFRTIHECNHSSYLQPLR